MLNNTEATKLISAFTEAININSVELYNKLLAEDVTFFNPVEDKWLTGIAGYVQTVDFIKSNLGKPTWAVKDIVYQDNKAFVLWEMKIENSHKSIEALAVYYINSDGKIYKEIGMPNIAKILKTMISNKLKTAAKVLFVIVPVLFASVYYYRTYF